MRVTCARCQTSLEPLDMSRGVPTFGGSLPALYNGVVCQKCKKIECTKCKGGKLDAPCSWCGGAVSPAFAHLLT